MADVTQSSDVSALKEKKQPEAVAQPATSEDIYAKLAAKFLKDNRPDVVAAINSSIGKVSPADVLAGSSLPGGAKAALSLVGAVGRAFTEQHAKQEARNAELQKQTETFRENLQKKVDPILTKYEANTDIKDETTRAQSIKIVEQFLKDPNSFNNREAGGVLKAALAQVVRPEFKRIQEGGGSVDVGSVSAAVNTFFKRGAKNGDEFFNDLYRGTGVLDKNTKAEIQNVVDNYKELSKENYSNAVQPYKAMFQDVGLGSLVSRYLRTPAGYTLDAYTANPKAPVQKVELTPDTKQAKPPEGSTTIGTDGKTKFIMQGGKWVVQK